MKRETMFVAAIWFCFSIALGVQAQQPAKKTPARQETIQPKQSAKPPAGAVPKVYDGSWSGKTAQENAVAFEVVNGRITTFSSQGLIRGAGCSTESNTKTTVSQPITGSSFAVSAPGGPGGVSLVATGKFLSPAKACGVVKMTLHPIPGPPPGVPGHVPSCGGALETTWIAGPAGSKLSGMSQDCPSLPAQQGKPDSPEARYGVVPKQARAAADGYFISDLVLGDPPETVRLGQRLAGRLILERGSQAPSKRVAVELYWASPAGMITSHARVKLPSPGLESEAAFGFEVFSKQKLDENLDFDSRRTGRPKATLSKLEAVVRVVEVEVGPGGWVTGSKVLSNELSATLKIIEP